MMASNERQTVPRDAYFLLTVNWKDGFTHKVACRGYNLASQIRFTESIDYIDTYSYDECTQEEYELKVWGDGSDFEENTDGRTSKNKTQQKNPTKRKPRKEGSEDSKATRNTSGTSPRVAKEKPSVVRESKVRDVRKPKKDVRGTNDSRKKTVPKPRRST